MQVMSRKLVHALYLREMGGILTSEHRFFGATYQPQRAGTEAMMESFNSLLPTPIVGGRSNIRQYGDRFCYRWGAKLPEDFFMYAAQFGHGIVLWGIALGPQVEIPVAGPLGSATWLSGGCGPGASAATAGDEPVGACGEQ